MNAPACKFKDLRLFDLVPLAVAIQHENTAQLVRFGVQEHTVAEWAVILAEEAGEVQKEMCELHFTLLQQEDIDSDKTRKIRSRLFREAIQEATLALKVAEMMGVPDDD